MNRNIKHIALRSALALAFAGLAASSYAVEGTASATATVITPITISKAADLSFGKFARGAGGTVTVSTSGARTGSGTILSTVGSSPTAARFDVTGDAAATYAITYTGTSTSLADGATPANVMALSIHSDLTAGNATTGTVGSGTLNGSGAQSIYVGGTLTVNASQVAATYTGTVKVQVEYN